MRRNVRHRRPLALALAGLIVTVTAAGASVSMPPSERESPRAAQRSHSN